MRRPAIMSLLLLAVPAPALAVSQTAEDAVEESRRIVFGPPVPGRNPCRTANEDPETIVVCGSNEERERQRVPPSVIPAGEVNALDPRASPGMTDCERLCLQPLRITILDMAIGSGPRGRTRTVVDELRDAVAPERE